MSFYENESVASAGRLIRGINRIPWGIDFLDDALNGIDEHDVTLLGAGTGVGKTQIACHIAANAARLGKEVHYLALEAETGEIENRLLYHELAKRWFQENPMGKPGVTLRYISWLQGDLEDELQAMEKPVRLKLKSDLASLHTIYKQDLFGVSDFVKAFQSAVSLGTNLIVLDHLHYIDLDTQNELQAFKEAIREIRRQALKHKKPIVVVAHLRKSDRNARTPLPDIDDFYGTSDLSKISVNAVLVARAQQKSEDNRVSPTWIYLPKARHAGDATHYAGLCSYDLKTGSYRPGYDLYRVPRFGEPIQLQFEQFPSWAKRANVPEKAKDWLPKSTQDLLKGRLDNDREEKT